MGVYLNILQLRAEQYLLENAVRVSAQSCILPNYSFMNHQDVVVAIYTIQMSVFPKVIKSGGRESLEKIVCNL